MDVTMIEQGPCAMDTTSDFAAELMGQEGSASASDMQAVLDAWNTATSRLAQTHESLRHEVARLTRELEVKNQELARTNRLADLGRMASHLSHEVRNQLVPVSLYLSLLRRRLSQDAGGLEILVKVNAGLVALECTVTDLLSFTADRPPRWQSFLARDLIDEVCESLAPQLRAQVIDVEIDVPPTMLLSADREMLRRALLNLLLNALDAMTRGGELVITAYRSAGAFELEVADSGAGLPEETRRRAFEPFFTTKSGGTGLGLAIVERVMAAHGGSVTANNCPEGGAAFTLRIPQRALGAAA
jgi:signal transduction histidine kinase